MSAIDGTTGVGCSCCGDCCGACSGGEAGAAVGASPLGGLSDGGCPGGGIDDMMARG